MRGDSIRDFYAKTLALAGLGVLAGAGALVDYWPTGIQLPAVATAFDRPAAETLALNFTPVPDAIQGRASADVGQPSPVALAAFAGASIELVGGRAADLGIPPPAMLAVATSAPGGREIALSQLETVAPIALLASVPAVSSFESDGDGLITSAFKRTGTSIVRGGMKTGSSLLGVLRAVKGAVLKAIPG